MGEKGMEGFNILHPERAPKERAEKWQALVEIGEY